MANYYWWASGLLEWLNEQDVALRQIREEKRRFSGIMKNRPCARPYRALSIEVAQFSKATVIRVPDNHMIKHFDFEELPRAY